MKLNLPIIIPPVRAFFLLHLCAAGALILAGCASTVVSNRQSYVSGNLPRPSSIWVYSFAATPEGIPAESGLAGQVDESKMTPEQAEEAGVLGYEIARQLTLEIQQMGLPCFHAASTTRPSENDIIIRGYLVSVDRGDASKRFVLGFGAGGAELTTVVEGFQMTKAGLRKLGQGTLGAQGSKGPGTALGAATWLVTGSPIGLVVSGGLKVYGESSGKSKIEARALQTAKELGKILKERFNAEGWID